MRPTGGLPKQKGKMSAFRKVAGKARSASPFKKKFLSAENKAEFPHVTAEDDARVEISQDGERDEFEEGRDMYDPDAGESRTLNTLTRSLSLESGTETEDDGSLLSGYRTIEDSVRDEESLASFDAPKETMPPPEGKVFTKSVVLSSLNDGGNGGDSLVLRAQHRRIMPEKENHAFINVRVSDERRYTSCLLSYSHLTNQLYMLYCFNLYRHQAFLHLMW